MRSVHSRRSARGRTFRHRSGGGIESVIARIVWLCAVGLDLFLAMGASGATVSVVDYGAVPDDAGDDLAAITNAIAAVPAGGAALFLRTQVRNPQNGK